MPSYYLDFISYGGDILIYGLLVPKPFTFECFSRPQLEASHVWALAQRDKGLKISVPVRNDS